MRKIYFIFFAILLSGNTFGQAIANADMEIWHTGTSGTHTIYAPNSWYGFDSAVIITGETFGPLVGAGTDWHTQLFQENTLVHGGTASAKVMTLTQDIAGLLPGSFSSAKMNIDASVLIGGGDPMSALVFSGGTPTTLKINTVSAYVMYLPGIDTHTHVMGGPDSGMLTVQAISTIGGYDSVVGQGFTPIPASATFTQVTANVTYTNTVNPVNMVRIIFASSGAAEQTLDSSTLYVDDVSMTGEPQIISPPPGAVNSVAGAGDGINVYPNPAAGALYIDAPQNAGYSCQLVNVEGQVVATQALTGKNKIDVHALPQGVYMYSVVDNAGRTVKSGQVAIKN